MGLQEVDLGGGGERARERGQKGGEDVSLQVELLKI